MSDHPPRCVLVMETGVEVDVEEGIEELLDELQNHRTMEFICVHSVGSHEVWVRSRAVLAVIGWNQEA
jgi:hypothetical protein